jgi:hypothetical protein
MTNENENENEPKTPSSLPPGETVTVNDLIRSLEKLKENISGLTPIYNLNFPLNAPMPVQEITFGYTKYEEPGVFLMDVVASRYMSNKSNVKTHINIEEL